MELTQHGSCSEQQQLLAASGRESLQKGRDPVIYCGFVAVVHFRAISDWGLGMTVLREIKHACAFVLVVWPCLAPARQLSGRMVGYPPLVD
jgi:hypothetical protein